MFKEKILFKYNFSHSQKLVQKSIELSIQIGEAYSIGVCAEGKSALLISVLVF